MRTLSSSLLASQRAASADPYDRVHIVDPRDGTTYTFTTADSPNRIVAIQLREESYGGVASIVLDNSDGYFNAKNFKGQKVTIGWGYAGEYSNAPNLWVIGQVDKSVAGKVRTQLLCYDMWNMWNRSEVFAGGTKLTGTVTRSASGNPYRAKLTGATSGAVGRVTYIGDGYVNVSGVTGTFTTETATTADGSLTIVITQVTVIGATAGGMPSWKGDTVIKDIVSSLISDWCSVVVDSDDGSNNFQTYKPDYKVQLETPIRSVVKEMFDFTECAGRIGSDGNLHVLYLNPSPSVDYSYALDTGTPLHSFIEETRDRRLVTPNRVFTLNFDPYSVEPQHLFVGVAIDTDSYARLGKYLSRVVVMPSIGSQTDADRRASALINRAKASANAGEILLPMMNVGQELMDWVQITDNRSGNLVVSGRIGTIQRNFAAGEHSMTIILGNLETSADIDSAGDIVPAGSDIPVPVVTSTPETIPTSRLAPGAQAYICDLRFTSVDWDTVTWPACMLTLKSGNTQAILAGTKDFANDNPYYAYFVWGNSTLQWTQTYGNTIGEDRGLIGTCKRGTSTTDKAYAQNFFNDSILINRDKVMAGLVTDLQLAANAVTTAKIAAEAATGPKIAPLAIATGHIQALAIDAEKIQTDAVIARCIKGGEITGVKIAGDTIEATKLKSIFFITNTMWAGENKIKLSPTGLDIYGQNCKLRDTAGVIRGYLNATSTDAQIFADGAGVDFLFSSIGGHIVISAAAANKRITLNSALPVVFNADTRPEADNTRLLGHPSYKWNTIYRTNESACELPTTNSALEVIRKIKKPEIADGDYGNRHYFKDENMPAEVKFRPDKDKLPEGVKYEDTKEEIEFTRLMGVLTQAVIELTAKVDVLEKNQKEV